MKRFIRYLYEYEQGRRLRNVGFVKVEQGGCDSTLHIHGKGLHMKGERELALYLFYGDGDECVGIWQGTVDNVNPAINYRLYYTEEDAGSSENFEKINGIVLVSELGRRYAAIWNDAQVDVGHIRLLSSKESRETKEETKADERMDAPDMDTLSPEVMQPPENVTPPEDLLQQDNVQLPEDLPRQDDVQPPEDLLRQDDVQPPEDLARQDIEQPSEDLLRQDNGQCPEEVRQDNRQCSGEAQQDNGQCPEETRQESEQPPEEARQENEPPQPGKGCQCTKIQRNDLARLPRCEWKWANNSFLLHGYYNYHHLALIDDGNRFLLGVPGIYHPQEAKAANVFGFVEFIPIREIKVDLTDDEGSSNEQFGYWCRPVKRPLKM